MSDGIVRICNAHQMELRQLGATFACPQGHECPTDWSVKEDMPYVDPRTLRPTCPLHGCRLTGSGSILDCQYGHKCTTRHATQPQPRPEASMPVDKSTPKATRAPRSPRGTEHPHGTRQRYFQEVKVGATCEACRKAANDYAKAKKLEREGKASPKPRRVAAQAIATSLARRVPRPIETVVVPASQSAKLEGRIHSLRAELAAAEAEFLAHVATVVPNVEISRASA